MSEYKQTKIISYDVLYIFGISELGDILFYGTLIGSIFFVDIVCYVVGCIIPGTAKTFMTWYIRKTEI